MTDARAVLTPVHQGHGEVLDFAAGTFRKQILPVGSINYTSKDQDGKLVTRQLTFDKQYLSDLAKAFKDKAYDAVKFILAGPDNKHTLDPERVRGSITDVVLTDDGLDGVFQLSAGAAELVKEHPDLGVSARIVENLEHADGRKFGRAMHHVLGTLDPRVTGLRPWQAVELSNEDVDNTLDLSEAHYENPEEGEMGQKNGQVDDNNTDLGNEGSEGQQTFDFNFGEVEITDAEARAQIELANAAAAESTSRIHALELDLANSRWEKERGEYARAGVPPALLDLAAPLLSMPHSPVIDLSNPGGEDATVDVADVVRKILDETKGFVELSAERGHTFDLSQEDRDEALLSRWEQESPL